MKKYNRIDFSRQNPKKLEKEIAEGIISFLHDSPKTYFKKEDLYKDQRFSKIEKIERIFLINGIIDLFESIGMIDKIGKKYYNY